MCEGVPGYCVTVWCSDRWILKRERGRGREGEREREREREKVNKTASLQGNFVTRKIWNKIIPTATSTTHSF